MGIPWWRSGRAYHAGQAEDKWDEEWGAPLVDFLPVVGETQPVLPDAKVLVILCLFVWFILSFIWAWTF